LKLTLDTDRPIFLQIKEGIETDILNGVLKPDEQIPSTSQLVSLYQINPVTVLKGVNLLTDEGLLYKKRGVGMFVSPDAPEILQKRFHGGFAKEQLRPMIQLAIPLGITREELHELIDQIWTDTDSEDTAP
jgi:DNA-binding transcriptional regulator YhcF (GntR family)